MLCISICFFSLFIDLKTYATDLEYLLPALSSGLHHHNPLAYFCTHVLNSYYESDACSRIGVKRIDQAPAQIELKYNHENHTQTKSINKIDINDVELLMGRGSF